MQYKMTTNARMQNKLKGQNILFYFLGRCKYFDTFLLVLGSIVSVNESFFFCIKTLGSYIKHNILLLFLLTFTLSIYHCGNSQQSKDTYVRNLILTSFGHLQLLLYVLLINDYSTVHSNLKTQNIKIGNKDLTSFVNNALIEKQFCNSLGGIHEGNKLKFQGILTRSNIFNQT